MTNVDYFIDELGRLPHNGIHLTWFTDVDYDEEVVKITMKDRTRKPARSKVQLCPFEDIMAMVDPRLAAKSIINKMYYDFGEHIVDRKLLMSPDQAAGILREFAKDFEECGAWNISDEDLVTALKVAIKCLEVTL